MQAHVVVYFALLLILVAMLAISVCAVAVMVIEVRAENLEWRRWCTTHNIPVKPTLGEQARGALIRAHDMLGTVAETIVPKLKELQASFISLML